MAPGLRVNFPVHSATGTASTATVLFELDPGAELGVHTDSAEELLIILQGTAEARIGDEVGRLEKNQVGSSRRWRLTASATSATTCSACSGRSQLRPSCRRSSSRSSGDGPQVLVIGSPDHAGRPARGAGGRVDSPARSGPSLTPTVWTRSREDVSRSGQDLNRLRRSLVSLARFAIACRWNLACATTDGSE